MSEVLVWGARFRVPQPHLAPHLRVWALGVSEEGEAVDDVVGRVSSFDDP